MKINLNNKYDIYRISGKIEKLSLAEIFDSKKVVLFFYPRDNTPGCTVENKDFSCLKDDFEKAGYKIIGVSKDSIESHEKFIKKQNLQNDLISDFDLILHKELGTYGEKNNYGKTVLGVIRSTFIIDKNGEILKEFRNIRAKGHAERILKEI